jgi:hypothetical protein
MMTQQDNALQQVMSGVCAAANKAVRAHAALLRYREDVARPTGRLPDYREHRELQKALEESIHELDAFLTQHGLLEM